ncbi:MAG: hypothetical protein CMJ81_08210 [Planctomycetaceae bacterium]|nr:hypothetical protein [Planctomycetaceae bacterium]
MEFRHSGNGAVRRRRVLLDDNSAPSSNKATPNKSKRQAGSALKYAEAARADCEARISDLIPTRIYSLLCWFLGGFALVTGLVVLHGYRLQWVQYLGSGSLSILDLTQQPNLASWFSTVALAVASFTAVLIYKIRRHRVDDYRAGYRIWVWAAGFLLLASLNTAAGLEDVTRGIAFHLTGTLILGDGYVWWVLLVVAAFVPLACLLTLDLRRSPGATLVLLSAIGCYGMAALLRMQIIAPGDVQAQEILTPVATLLGHLMIVMGLWIFARSVYLGAQEKVPLEKMAGAKKNRGSAAEIKLGVKNGSQEKHLQDTSQTCKTDLEIGAETESCHDNLADSSDTETKQSNRLSKAERRRLRKQQRRQNKAA